MTTPLQVFGIVAVGVVIAAGCGSDDTATSQRRAEIAERGSEVMPFDLDATTHTFDQTDQGGVQTVVADRESDLDQIQLVREHLREERDRFAQGDFDDPAAIHGHDMPGLEELRAGYGDVSVAYLDLPDGGRIVYRTDRADLVDAIHAWFDRQRMDHGDPTRDG